MSLVRYNLPTEGIVTSAPSDGIDPKYSPNLKNVRFRFGQVYPAPGRLSFAPPVASKPRTIARFSVDDQTKWLIMITDTDFYTWGSGAPGAPAQWTKRNTVALTGIGRWSWCSGEDHIFFTRDGSNGIWRWGGSGNIDKVPSAPYVEQARYVEYYNHRLLAGSIVDTGKRWSNRVRWPINGDHNDWAGDGSGFLDFYEPEQEPLQGLKVLGNRCVVFREHSLVEMVATGTLDPVFQSEQRTVNVGTIFPFTIATNGVMIFFLGNDGNVWGWNGTNVAPIGGPIEKTLEKSVDIRAGYEYFGLLYPFTNEYWLFLSGNLIYAYDYLRNRWMIDDFPQLTALGDADIAVTPVSWDQTPNSWGSWNTSWEQMRPKYSSRMVAALTDYSTITIGEDLTGLEDGSPVTCSIETPDFYLAQDPMTMVTIEQVMLVYDYNN